MSQEVYAKRIIDLGNKYTAKCKLLDKQNAIIKRLMEENSLLKQRNEELQQEYDILYEQHFGLEEAHFEENNEEYLRRIYE